MKQLYTCCRNNAKRAHQKAQQIVQKPTEEQNFNVFDDLAEFSNRRRSKTKEFTMEKMISEVTIETKTDTEH